MLFIKIAVLFSLSYTLPQNTERQPREERQKSPSTKSTFLNIAFRKKSPTILKKLTHFLKRLTQYLTKFTHFEVYFAVPPAKFSHLYTLHFTPYTRKIALKCDFSCTSANFVVPLHQILEGNIRMKTGKFTYGNSVIFYATASESLLSTLTPPINILIIK